MQNLTHQPPQPPQAPRCAATLREHLSSLPALQHTASNHPMLQDWLQHMLTEAAARNQVMLSWYASRADGYLLGLSFNSKRGVTGELLELGQLCRRLSAEAGQ
ncbi:MAG TPA: hypothetical protein DEP32_03095 [Pseudomonas sp.]|uniref:Uncharacterized protein n=1 Tax=Halopseudomonas oceani TaxID=1708783 RepID=A0A2P4EU73_9GAMM|nr:hypothetical protein [Halopseudomonas oceani]MAQ51997.1 hypothetical protein [Pseudomonas sp.]MBB49189.1 hypothetical protein [Pseudomonadales bacterium]MBF77490.1 hypothetical protein [Pseudomonadales bacterium]POB02996.1 hypothetical protein C1949_11555 [Halopseudomonas oceani]GGE50394.1 hypothetical protein GCM10007421_25880 [Halopseudomonas oceani]|tara:strand:- start:7626 stop:7934 length:309 start_codon:yes stop_codon:yes gene_type:complete